MFFWKGINSINENHLTIFLHVIEKLRAPCSMQRSYIHIYVHLSTLPSANPCHLSAFSDWFNYFSVYKTVCNKIKQPAHQHNNLFPAPALRSRQNCIYVVRHFDFFFICHIFSYLYIFFSRNTSPLPHANHSSQQHHLLTIFAHSYATQVLTTTRSMSVKIEPKKSITIQWLLKHRKSFSIYLFSLCHNASHTTTTIAKGAYISTIEEHIINIVVVYYHE